MRGKINDIAGRLLAPDFDHGKCIEEIKSWKQQYLANGDEENANLCWVIAGVVHVHKEYRDLYNLLKQKEYVTAWGVIDSIQIECENILRNCPGMKPVLEFVNRIVGQIQRMFPYRVFTSSEIVVKERVCSVCKQKRQIRKHCGHYVGYLYHGEMCYDTITKVELKGISLVTNPEHKSQVVLGNGKYDYSVLDELISKWPSPYHNWFMYSEVIYIDPSNFDDLSDDRMCPCGSMKTYAKCCKNNPNGGIKYIHYKLSAKQKQ